MNKDLIIKDMKDIVTVFKKHGAYPILSYGALLGAVREKDFIEWDDDVDFDIIDDSGRLTYEKRKAIGWDLYDIGFLPQPIGFNVFGRIEPAEIGYNGTDKTGIIVCRRNANFSLFFYEKLQCPKHGEEYVCTPKVCAMKLISIPAKFFESNDRIKLHGVEFMTPSPIKEYLAYVYGDDWKKPIKGKHAPQYNKLHEREILG